MTAKAKNKLKKEGKRRMEDKDLVFDREHHILYSKQCKKEILRKFSLHYSDEEAEKNFYKGSASIC